MERKILVTESSMPPLDDYINEIKDIWDTHWLTNMGIKHQKLQYKLEEYLKCKHVSLFVNGHLALENIIESFNFSKGSEIITTPFTFVSTTHAIVRSGCVPVFCDINDEDYTIDVTKIEPLINEKTVAILPVHVYGNICDVEGIDRIAKKHNLRVIYDAAHAFGVKYKGNSIANYGDASMFSFHATKVFNTIEGGAACYTNDEYVQILNDLKNFGIRNEEECHYIGGNAKMNEFQAAMGICNLKYIDKWINERKTIVEQYKKRLSNIKGIKLCDIQIDVESNYAYFPVVFDNYKYTRDQIYEKLKEKNIYSRKYFYPLVTELDCYKNCDWINNYHLECAKRVSDNVLTLPLYPSLEKNIIDEICDIVLI